MGMQFVTRMRARLADTFTDEIYTRFLPHIESPSGDLQPANGSGNLFPPADYPFALEDPLVSLFATSPEGSPGPDASRALWVSFRIRLAKPSLVGGILYSGLPTLPARINEHGETKTNFGLPRELRLTCFPEPNVHGVFIDSELNWSVQEMISHSGLHYLRTEPTWTDFLLLRLSDFPLFGGVALPNSELPNNPWDPPDEGYMIREGSDFHGFAIPYFSVFTYAESSRYRPRVPAGLLGVTAPDRSPDAGPELYPELIHTSPADQGKTDYMPFTAASMLREGRTFIEKSRNLIKECFVSEPLESGEQVVVFLEQGEDYERCVAGIQLEPIIVPHDTVNRDDVKAKLLQLLQLPEDVRFCSAVRIRVYELDPPEGISPTTLDRAGKYCTLHADQLLSAYKAAPEAPNLQRSIRFLHPTTVRFLAVELTNAGADRGSLVVRQLNLQQSAHVSVQPRPAKTQRLRAVHFRFIGRDLAEDFAGLGSDGFSISIERLVAGETKDVLLSARSLLDLQHLGLGRLFSNTRRRAVEDEIVDQGPKIGVNTERRLIQSRASGWRAAASRDDLSDPVDWDPLLAAHNGKYGIHSNQEIRTHSRHLYPDSANILWLAGGAYLNALSSLFNGGETLASLVGADGSVRLDQLFQGGPLLTIPNNVELYAGWHSYWGGLVADQESLRIDGTRSFVQSPFGVVGLTAQAVSDVIRGTEAAMTLLTLLATGEALLDPTTGLPLGIKEILQQLAPLGDIAGILGLIASTAGSGGGSLLSLPLLNGANVSFSGQPLGLGVSISAAGGLTPSVTETASSGTAGQIALQASRTGASFAKQQSSGFDHVRMKTDVQSSTSTRRVERREVADADQRVRGADVVWQGQIVDIVSGSLPLDITLPATAGRMYRTSDDSIRVRLGTGIGDALTVDVWFDVIEEPVRDDH
jgi:hypothetical protein